jgi:hypothetical protein
LCLADKKLGKNAKFLFSKKVFLGVLGVLTVQNHIHLGNSESVVIFQPEIVYFRPAQQLQQEIPEKPEHGIKNAGQRPGFEHPIIEAIKYPRTAADQRQGVNRVGTVIKPIAHFQHHALIDIQSPRGYFVHDRAPFSRIDQF